MLFSGSKSHPASYLCLLLYLFSFCISLFCFVFVFCWLAAGERSGVYVCIFFLNFFLYLYFAGWQRGRGLVHLSGSVSHPAIYPLHRQERIEYIKISFTEITKIRKKPPAPIPNKGFFAPSGVESINPGPSIV